MALKTLPRPTMVNITLEFLDQLFWKLHRILDREGVSMLQWAILQRAYLNEGSVPFSVIFKATGDSKDNVRRAAKFLQDANLGEVIVDPHDRRARILILSQRGRKCAMRVSEAYKAELLASVGARETFSKRVRLFTFCMWRASGFLGSGDLADEEMIDLRECNRAAVSDDSLRYVELSKRATALSIDPEKLPF
jgi:DNA-binding MarR family transcriptional regulator